MAQGVKSTTALRGGRSVLQGARGGIGRRSRLEICRSLPGRVSSNLTVRTAVLNLVACPGVHTRSVDPRRRNQVA